jgi:L-threonylcarbamoyladenylate synthase
MKTKQNLTITEAAKLLKQQEIVAFPTETVYGLGADATSDVAINKIFLAKGRPNDNPLIVHIGDLAQLSDIVSSIPSSAQQLIDAFWPGPLTIVLPKQKHISDALTAGLDTVGVRMPSHPIALQLLQEVKLPLAAPSANVSGKPSPTTSKHVYDDLNGKIAGIVDGGETTVGLESTVIDCNTDIVTILRPGSITQEDIELVIGPVQLDVALNKVEAIPKSPGLKYQHYAPNAKMSIVEGSIEFFQDVIDQAKQQG